MNAILFAKYAPIWGFAACISSLVLFYGLAFVFVGKNKQATNVAVAVLVVTAFFIPLYCAGLSVYFLFYGKHTAVAIIGLLLNGGWVVGGVLLFLVARHM